MKNKSTIILGALFLALIVVYFLVSYNPREVTEGARPLFEDGFPEIDKVEFTSKNRGHIVLEKQDGEWFMTEPLQYKAYDTQVDMMLEELKKARIEGIISSREEVRDKYSVGDSTGTLFTASNAGQVVFEAIIGKQSLQIGHMYARMKDSDDIMMWRGMFSQEVIRPVDDWRDRKVYTYNPGDIVAAKIEEDGMVRQLALDDTVWVYTENGEEKPVSSQNVVRSLAVLGSLICDDFADQSDIPRAATRKPDVRVSFTVRNGDVNVYDVWVPDESMKSSRYLLRKEGGDLLYRFYEGRGRFITLDYQILAP